MSEIVKLDDYRPHFQVTDPVTGSVHVLPMVRALLFALLAEVAE